MNWRWQRSWPAVELKPEIVVRLSPPRGNGCMGRRANGAADNSQPASTAGFTGAEDASQRWKRVIYSWKTRAPAANWGVVLVATVTALYGMNSAAPPAVMSTAAPPDVVDSLKTSAVSPDATTK